MRRNEQDLGVVVAGPAQAAAGLDAVDAGHFDVEQDDIGRLVAGGQQRLAAVEFPHLVTRLFLQQGRRQHAGGRIVVHDEDFPAVLVHVSLPPCPSLKRRATSRNVASISTMASTTSGSK